jgi:hypothetical protein
VLVVLAVVFVVQNHQRVTITVFVPATGPLWAVLFALLAVANPDRCAAARTSSSSRSLSFATHAGQTVCGPD